MADYTSWTETITTARTRFTLRLPTNYVEVDKLMHGVVAAWKTAHPGQVFYDDSITVISEDDETLIFQWEDQVTGRA